MRLRAPELGSLVTSPMPMVADEPLKSGEIVARSKAIRSDRRVVVNRKTIVIAIATTNAKGARRIVDEAGLTTTTLVTE